MSTNATYVERLEAELLDAVVRRRWTRTVITRLAAMTVVSTAVVGALLLARNGSPPALASTSRAGSRRALRRLRSW